MRNLTFTYVIALAFIAIVIVVSQFLIQKAISESSSDSRIVNISGRQRMLSQKLSKTALAMKDAISEDEYTRWQKELSGASKLINTSHLALQFGDASLDLAEMNNSNEIKKLFSDLAPFHAALKQATEQLSSLEYDDDNKEAVLSEAVGTVLNNEKDFLTIMNDITFEYDRESKNKLVELSSTEYILLAVALLLLIAEAFLIFRPAINKINDYTDKLLKQERSLQTALEETKEQKERVDYLNQQSETVFENVNQGIFLLNKDNKISDIHSNALKKILMVRQDIKGEDFLDLMKSKLVQRDLEALQMFLKHIYNPDIEEDVLNQLNPVSEVEIFSNQRTKAKIDSKHLKISFYRIGDKNDIQNVLVNITDETEAVELHKRIKLSEERTKRESEQLLSILKVDPKELEKFISKTVISLLAISKNYEGHKGSDFRSLIDETFVTIHKLKGNAQLINLQLVAERFHKLEETIADVKHKDEIVGGDFIKILYEINEINQMVTSMEGMLERISDIQGIVSGSISNIGTKKPKSSLISTLRQGVQKITQETNKQVQLNFIDTGAAVPKELEEPIQDMLVQLTRNSIAHGIEASQTRLEMGKSSKGNIDIKFDHDEQGIFQLTYKDDGAGIDLKEVVKKALDLKLISKEEISSMTKETAIDLIFESDLSTTENVDEYSGRGQGLGLVKTYAAKLGGNYDVKTKRGKGFAITINLPSTELSIV